MMNFIRLIFGTAVLCVLSPPVFAEIPSHGAARIPALTTITSGVPEDGHYRAQLNLQNGSLLTLIVPDNCTTLAGKLSTFLSEVHREFETFFGALPQIKASIRLADDEFFFRLTGAPSWTSAVYFRKEIVIRLEASGQVDLDALRRAVRHEYAHAVVHALSGGKCPGWLDEGLAQWVEGGDSAAIRPSLREWLVQHEPVRLSLLQEGFTKLDAEMVPPAYAQSFLAAHELMSASGFKSIRSFFDRLRQGQEREAAFEQAFSMSEHAFEKTLDRALRNPST